MTAPQERLDTTPATAAARAAAAAAADDPEAAAGTHTAAPEDLLAEEVAPGVHRLPLPIPFEVGPVNCYLIRREEGDEPILIDTGPKTDDAYRALREHLSALGLVAGDLKHIIITHAHIDHHGNLKRLVDASDARVYVHEDDAAAVLDYHACIDARGDGLREVFAFWGFPRDALSLVDRFVQKWRAYGDTVARKTYVPIAGEEALLRVGGVTLVALHCPGHTEGLVCLFRPEDGLLFVTDHILNPITPNPTVYTPKYRGRRTGLADYVRSLEKLRELPAKVLLPGHGRPFGGLAKRVQEILLHHHERAEKVIGLLRGARKTVIEVAGALFGDLPPGEVYLACREVHGHLDILFEAGRIHHVEAEGVGYYWVE